jgi:glycosyltransferase involved in cell wall biosynthesis
MKSAIVHDYLTQRGGAERVVLSMLKALPEAPLYTSLYEPKRTFPEFGAHEIHATALNVVPLFRRSHRLALPLLASAFSRLSVPAEVVVCSSSGWAHGAHVEGRKIVYCHSPARWLYQTSRYVGGSAGLKSLAVGVLRRPLESWDKRAAATADRYLVNSTAVQRRVRELYGIEAEVLAPPPALTSEGAQEEVVGVGAGFFLCVSRLLPYKNVDVVAEALRALPKERLVVVGSGPEQPRLASSAPENVRYLSSVTDAQLRWLYARSKGIVTASYEDFGLTPLEAASFATPSAVLHWGGFRDTVVDGETGVFFEEPTPAAIAQALERLLKTNWDGRRLLDQAEAFSEARFVRRLQEVVAEERRAT